MIVYNVTTRFFDMKKPADDLRRAKNLPPASLHKITINNRQQLAAFLDGLCNASPTAPVTCLANADIPDFVPKFLHKDYAT